MARRVALIYGTAIASSLLAAYGASYGVRLSNGVLMAGLAGVILASVAEYQVRRRVTVPLVATALIAGFFALIGLPTLALPTCSPIPASIPCAGAGARERTFVALIAGTAAVALLVLQRAAIARGR